MVSASFLCNLLLGVESVFLVSSQPGARLHFDVKEVQACMRELPEWRWRPEGKAAAAWEEG